MAKRKMSRKKKRKIILTLVLILLSLIVLLASVWFILTQQTKVPVVDKDHQIFQSQQAQQATALSEADEKLLADYQSVFVMLSSQDISQYTEELQQRIQQQKDRVQQLLDEQNVNDLEVHINQYAQFIDEGLFTGDASQLFYARGILIMNKTYCATANFQPGNRPVMKEAFQRMQAAAAQEGIQLNDFSTYRSYAGQKSLFDRYVAKDGEAEASRYSSRPGCSEHQSGYVADIGGSNSANWAETSFDGTSEANWLEQHAAEYGFVMRYPPGKEEITGYMHESWHFRYVGDIAVNIAAENLTLEEYLGVI